MVTEILQIQPRLDSLDASKMERSLNTRFSKIAKGFGKGLLAASKLALGAAVLTKLINPLNEVKEAIDRTLEKADGIVTNAKQFSTTTENLLKVRALGNVKGLDDSQVDLLLTKFQGAVAQAKKDPTDEANSSVRAYINEADTAKAFYNFITNLQKKDKNEQVLVQQQVFGERQVLKMAEFIGDTGFKESLEAISKLDFKKIAAASEKLAVIEDLQAKNNVNRNYNDIINKANVITPGTVNNINKSETASLTRENNRIRRSGELLTIEEKLIKASDLLEELQWTLIDEIGKVDERIKEQTAVIKEFQEAPWYKTGLLYKIYEAVQKTSKAPATKGIKSMFGQEE